MAGWGYNRNLGNTQIEVAWFLQGLLLPLRDIGFLNQLAKVSSSPTGIMASQTMLEDFEARTVPLSMATISRMMSVAMRKRSEKEI